MSWRHIYHRFFTATTLVIVAAASFAGEPAGDTAWRPSTRTMSTRTIAMQSPAIAPTAMGNSCCPSPACAAEYREETYTVRRPVLETSMREEQFVRYEPVTTFMPQQVDQGTWVDQQTVRPGRTVTRLRWFDGGWTVDPATGREYWRLPMWRPVRIRQPDKAETVRVWKPNVVTISVPKVSYQPRVHVRQVPVQTVRYVEERRIRKVPVRGRPLLDRILPGGPTPTFGAPPADTLPPVVTEPAPAAEAAQPANVPRFPVLPKPELDPRDSVPGPSIVPQSQPSDDNTSRPRSQGRDRVAAML